MIVQRHLGAWAGQASHEEKHPEPRFHRRFCRGLGQLDRAPQFGYALCTPIRFAKGAKFGEGDDPFMQSHIKRDHSVYKHSVAAQVDCRAQSGGDPKAFESHDFDGGQRRPPKVDAGPIRGVGVRDCDLYRIDRW
ncbi:MAG TPA: hypothetical protein VES90_08365 [Candidatus Eisenbacteria bacterium]|nr:hypothetical protein [Candidatus Eisenbacteria bacterium]